MTEYPTYKKDLSRAKDDTLIQLVEDIVSVLTAGRGYDQEYCNMITLLQECERELTLRENN